jgi:hypothetical protein
VTPQAVIISPERGLPANPAIDKFKAADVQYIFRTEIDGDVTLISDGTQKYTLQASRISQDVTLPEFGKSDDADGGTNTAVFATMVAATAIVVVIARAFHNSSRANINTRKPNLGR